MNKIDRTTRVPVISAGDFYNSIADTDSRRVPDVMREARTYERDEDYFVPVDRFLTREYHDLEVERLWKRVWQMACREEEIPEVGDVYVYEIASMKFLIVRTAPDTIKAYPNSCLHRGRQLVDCNKRVSEIRCPFHAITWSLQGDLKSIPCAWEFDHITDPADWKLPEVKVGRWGGFVFINPDPDSESLESFLGDLNRQFENYPLEDRYISGHARMLLKCNWKVAQEAFLEAYHVYGTHPQLLPSGAHSDMKYDVYENYSRAVGINNLPNTYTSFDADDQDILNAIMDVRADEEPRIKAEEGRTPRQIMAEMARKNFEAVTGRSSDFLSDSELIDTNATSVFPNFGPWSLFSRLCYLFRPYRNDPDRCYMDVYELKPFDAAKGRPAPAKVHLLGEDDDWTKATDLNAFFARVANQDLQNLAMVQEGLKSSVTGVVRYSKYQESRIRHIHYLLRKWIGQ